MGYTRALPMPMELIDPNTGLPMGPSDFGGASDVTLLAKELTLQAIDSSIDTLVTDTAAIKAAALDTAAVNIYPAPTTPVSGATAAMTGTASTQVLAAPGAGLRNYVTAFIVSNTDADTDTEVEIRDGDGGTVLLTLPAPKGYGGSIIPLPTPLKQPTANTRLDAKCTVSGSTTKVSAVGYTL